MQISSLKELQQLIALCRKTGVQSIKVDNVEFHLGEERVNAKRPRKYIPEFPNQPTMPTYAPGGITADTKIETSELTDEQLLFYSSEGPSNEFET